MVSIHILFEMQSSFWKVSGTLLPQDCLLLSAAAPFQILSFSLVLFLASAMSVARYLQGDNVMGGPCLQPPGKAASLERWSKEALVPLLDIAVAVPGSTMAKGMVFLLAHLCVA